jgi:hypothetical protein
MLHGAIYKIVALDHCESGKGWARDNLNKIEAVRPSSAAGEF